MTITLTQAEQAIHAAKAFTSESNLPPVNIAVVDGAAHLVGFARMDGAILGGVDVAEKKARTAALFRLDSRIVGGNVLPGAPYHTLENSNGGLIGFGGGVVLYDTQDRVIGALGISGGSADEDERIAQSVGIKIKESIK